MKASSNAAIVQGVLSWPDSATRPGPRSRIVAITARASASLIGRHGQFGVPRTEVINKAIDIVIAYKSATGR